MVLNQLTSVICSEKLHSCQVRGRQQIVLGLMIKLDEFLCRTGRKSDLLGNLFFLDEVSKGLNKCFYQKGSDDSKNKHQHDAEKW